MPARLVPATWMHCTPCPEHPARRRRDDLMLLGVADHSRRDDSNRPVAAGSLGERHAPARPGGELWSAAARNR